MTDYPVFANAPIVEALIDIQVDLPPEVTLSDLAKFQDSVKDRFPIRREQSMMQFQFAAQVGIEPQISQSSGVTGYLFLSSEREPSKAVQARLNGYTFSKFKPYNSWAEFRNEALELWSLYRSITNPVRIRRLGLRTINRIEIPIPFERFEQYLLTLPKIAPGIDGGISEFLVRFVMPQTESDEVAIVTIGTDATQTANQKLPVLFDIDVYNEAVFDPSSSDPWDRLERLRGIKNTIFFKSITPDTMELFK